MQKIDKPKLVFFQLRHDGNLPEFVLLHRQEHVKCLSEFFDVTVISENCDYQQICDRYQPDLTLFESGVNYKSVHRLDIKNTHTHQQIPKLGLHNGDSWCEDRTVFLSDMEHWGIETFFSICTTTAEYTPEIAGNLFVWPNCIDPDLHKDYSQDKSIPILITGTNESLIYLWRQKINPLITKYYSSKICQHLGYTNKTRSSRMIYGQQYAKTINSSWFVPTCGTIVKEVVRKHFEIPGSKSCLITEKTPAVEAAGFIDMYNCVFADESNVLDKLDYLFKHPDELDRITVSGYELVHSRHTIKQRDQIFQWFNLYKNLKPNQRIIQTNPFQPLTTVEKSSGIQNSHIIGNGLLIELLRQGDDKLWAGKYEEAESLYLECLKYRESFPEPKLRLAMCSLYKGNAENALSWIIEPLKHSLEERKALAPDPVAWAYFIISLLCQGRLVEANVSIDRFPSICHSELDRTRWAIDCLKNQGEKFPQPESELSKQHYSIHHLPHRNFTDWINNLCTLLQACQQFTLAEMLLDSTFSYSQQQEKRTKSILRVSTNRISSIRINYLKPLNNLSRKLHVYNFRSNSSKILELDYILIPFNFAKTESISKIKYILKRLIPPWVYHLLKK
jgi:tetratricopeptide (TPR) repeat protein